MERPKGMLSYTCSKGGQMILAFSLGTLQQKIDLHNEMRHGPDGGGCRPISAPAPIHRAYQNECAFGVTKGGY